MLRKALIFLSESNSAKAVVTKTPLRRMSRRFVPGETVSDFLRAAADANEIELSVTGNYLGEAEHDERTAKDAVAAYLRILDGIIEQKLDGNISVKPTQVGLEIGKEFFKENLRLIMDRAKEHDIFIRWDMESSEWTQATLDPFEELWEEGYRNMGTVLQSYLLRTMDDALRMNELGVRVRLCKGAYAEPPEVAFQGKETVDRNFVEVAKALLFDGNYPALATHDDEIIKELLEFVEKEGIGPERFEFQMLHGVRRDLQQELRSKGYNVRVYVPFGESWYPYLMRRLAERPANMLFFAGSVIRESPLGFLWPKPKKSTESG
ncbi:MAG: proline dehydrogenase family protein [Gemmatimonadetes bacterium]|nr:proline dehydrogenase family protein [Gemmatimonadota bacterium]